MMAPWDHQAHAPCLQWPSGPLSPRGLVSPLNVSVAPNGLCFISSLSSSLPLPPPFPRLCTWAAYFWVSCLAWTVRLSDLVTAG